MKNLLIKLALIAALVVACNSASAAYTETTDNFALFHCDTENASGITPDDNSSGRTDSELNGDVDELRVSAPVIIPPDPDSVFTDIPKDMQVCQRLPSTNIANVKIAGTISSPGLDSITVRVYRESVLQSVLTQALVYSAGDADFNFLTSIKAELANYDFTVATVAGSTETTIATVDNVVGGDVYLINGQSNANAMREPGSASANVNQGQFLRSFGTHSDSPGVVINDLNWHLAEGDKMYGQGAIGQWAIRMGRVLIEETGIPIAIINNGNSGKPISFFERNDSNPEDIGTNYGRLLFRARNAGVTNKLRAILWYQGESDSGAADVHENGFTNLYNNWLEDYPGFEEVLIHQLRVGCLVAQWNVSLRNRQRLIPDKFPDIEVMSTTGLNGHNGCHFVYNNGYKELGEHDAALLMRDLYGSSNTINIEPPNIDNVFFSDIGNTNIIIVMRNKVDSLIWNSGVENYFNLENSGVNIIGGGVASNTVILQLDGNGSSNDGLTYSGHSGSGPWVLNGKGVGLLTFFSDVVSIGPAKPRNLIAVPLSCSSIQLKWDSVSNVIKYLIRRDGEIIGSSFSTSYVDVNLSKATKYCYEVASVDLPYTSTWSDVKCATTGANLPAALLFEDTFNVTGGGNINYNYNESGRQFGSLAPLTYTTYNALCVCVTNEGPSSGKAKTSVLNYTAAPPLLRCGFSPDQNFNNSGNFSIEYELTRFFEGGWASVEFGHNSQNVDPWNPDGGMSVRFETNGMYVVQDGGNNVTGVFIYSELETNTLKIKIVVSQNDFSGSDAHIALFVNEIPYPLYKTPADNRPRYIYTRAGGFTNNYISFMSGFYDTNSPGHLYDNLKISTTENSFDFIGGWSDDESSLISNSKTYSHAVNLGVNDNLLINDVTFRGEGSNTMSGSDWKVEYFGWHPPDSQNFDLFPFNIETNSVHLLDKAFYNGDSDSSLRLSGLRPGFPYKFTLYNVGLNGGDDAPHRRVYFATSADVNVELMDANKFGVDEGNLLTFYYIAPENGVFSISQTALITGGDATWPWYAFSNEEIQPVPPPKPPYIDNSNNRGLLHCDESVTVQWPNGDPDCFITPDDNSSGRTAVSPILNAKNNFAIERDDSTMPTFKTGSPYSGNYLAFDGNDSIIVNNAWQGGNVMALNLSFRFNGLPDASGDNFAGMFWTYPVKAYLQNSGDDIHGNILMLVYNAAGNFNYFMSSKILSPNVWYHLSFSALNNNLQVVVGNDKEGYMTETSTAIGLLAPAVKDVIIGSDYFGPTRLYQGDLDEIQWGVAIPEPATFALLIVLGLACLRKKYNRNF